MATCANYLPCPEGQCCNKYTFFCGTGEQYCGINNKRDDNEGNKNQTNYLMFFVGILCFMFGTSILIIIINYIWRKITESRQNRSITTTSSSIPAKVHGTHPAQVHGTHPAQVHGTHPVPAKVHGTHPAQVHH